MQELSLTLRVARYILIGLTILASGVVLGLLVSSGFELPGPGAAGIPSPPGHSELAATPAVDEPSLPAIPPSPFVAVARRVVPAVVYVDADRRMKHPPIDDGTHGDLFRRLFPPGESRDEIEIPSSGSGFIIDDAGHVLTNNHVVNNADKITVHLGDGRTYAGEIIGTDDKTDVAVLKITRQPGDPALPTVRLGNSDQVEVGEWAMAIGNPLGQLEGSVTVGVVSAKGRSDLDIAGGGPDYQDFIQTDASINFGNSGGPLVNTRAEVIGINTAINPTGQGLGFAIPINMARSVSEQLIATGKVTRAYMGIVPLQLTPELAEGLGIPPTRRGILVASVEADGPAEKAGLKQKEVILSFNGVPVTEVNRFRRLVAESRVDSQVELKVWSRGQEITRVVHLARRPDETAAAAPAPAPRSEPQPAEWLGAQIQAFTREMAGELNVPYTPGILVNNVVPGSAADEAGLEDGDLIVELDDAPVRNLMEWRTAIEKAERGTRPIVLRISRGGATSYLAVRPSRP